MRLSSGGLGNQQNDVRKFLFVDVHYCWKLQILMCLLPPFGYLIGYVAVSTNKEFDSLPSYPSLPPQLADVETDEVYGQMTLQPLSPDFSQQPPAQELIAKDLHGNEWKFRHIFRGQPKRHLLTTGWSVNDDNQLLLGIRRANRPQTVMPSSVLSSDSMHIGLLAAAAHAAATNSRFTIFYNPRASPSEFVIPLAKYVKAVHHTRVSVGMRFRMLFETEESGVRRYMGTITGISDLNPVRWPNSHWRSVKVGWDESTAGQRQPRVSLWEIEPLTTFPMYPSPFPFRLKRPWPTGLPSLYGGKDDISLNSPLLWLRNGGNTGLQSLNFQGIGITPWTQPNFDTPILGLQPGMYQAMAAAGLQETRTAETTKLISPSVLPFQQTQNITTRASPMLPSQVLEHGQSQPPQTFLQDIQVNQAQSQSQAEFLRHQLRQEYSFGSQQQLPQQKQTLPHQQMQQQKFLSTQQVPTGMSALPELIPESQSPSTALQNILSFSQPQNFSNSNGNFVRTSNASSLHDIFRQLSPEDASNLLGWSRGSQVFTSSSPWPSKRVAVESMLPSGDRCVMPRVEQSGVSQPNIALRSVTLPPFPGRECMVDQDGNMDGQNHLLFGVNIDSSPLVVQNGMANLSNIGNETDSMNVRYAASNFVASSGNNDFALNQTLTGSNRLEEPGFLHSPENVDSLNPKSGTSVKVYKSGSFGRSLDITKFSSYHELRGELGRLFGLEGQLEDPLRSGWQLVFVDRENDILLVGDDPWHEFVNSVWCIKILSPQEVQQMGKQSVDFLNPTCIKRLANNSCDGYINRQDSRNLSTGIASVGTLEY
ncbi:hypothetical protein MUK42_37057 [Musa troglodytarum]|uniref:Auxin-responsive protein n=1 Tax=Musa troglodytarum TaxID=320322 RepID=A0A9E7ESY1_9LILI|nr:hypothetical protein MUK42_37057 [Musa troglodytarum]